MGRIVIACYRPKPGKQEDLRRLTADHVPTLRSLGLVTDRAAVAMEAEDGTIVEVFEWASRDAIEAAHGNPTVQAMWQAYDAVCDYVPIGAVPEAARLFSEFTPIPGPA
jgi:quinol monooxygenase YgiN